MAETWHAYEAAREMSHPVVVAADLHERVAAIHPFIDGNGRTARLVMNVHLLQYGYPLVSIPSDRDSRLAYYEALDVAASGRDPHAFQAFLVARIGATLSRYLTILGDETTGGV